MAEVSVFDQVGGQVFFDRLVELFYDGVETDSVLRPLYPEDLEPGKRALALFLGQYWGGPTTYSDVRGHPRLRMRHFPFRIGQSEHDAWLHHMLAAVVASHVDEAPVSDELQQAFTDYFTMAAAHLVNSEN